MLNFANEIFTRDYNSVLRDLAVWFFQSLLI